MRNPYTVLEIEPGADDAAIRHRYLDLVRQYPPEQEPRKAAEIRAAYDALRDPIRRLERQLFEVRITHSFDELIREQQQAGRNTRQPTEILLSLGKA